LQMVQRRLQQKLDWSLMLLLLLALKFCTGT
jgi:hypothetical protein